MNRSLPLFLVSFLVLSSTAIAESGWTQFRGASRDGLSTEKGLTRSFPAEGPPELWRRPIGPAFSGIVSDGAHLYTTESDEEGDYVLKLDPETGKNLWRQRIADQYSESFGNGPRVTPAIDGDHLYAMSGGGHVAALKRADGDVVWTRDLMGEFGIEKMPTWGFASAPLIVGDQLIVSVGAPEKSSVVAFDKASGKTLWHTGDAEAAYGSPVVVEAAGQRHLVVLDKPGVVGLTLDGKELWRHEWETDVGVKPALPIFVAPDLLVASASYGAGAIGLRLQADGDGIKTEEVWRNKIMRNHFNSSVLVDGTIYGFDNSTLKAFNPKTGEHTWAKRGGLGKGTLIYADGMLVVLTETGTLKLVEARPDVFSELASHRVLSGRCWTDPTLVDGNLYLRNGEEMVAYNLRGSGATSQPTAVASAENLPAGRSLTLDQVLDRHAEALGGAEKLNEVRSIRVRGTLEANGDVGPFTFVRKGKHTRTDGRMWGMPMVMISDGEKVWQTDMRSQKLAPVDEKMSALGIESGNDYGSPLLNAKDQGHKLELVGDTEVDGTPAHHLRLTLESGRSQDFYVARDSFLILKKSFGSWNNWQQDYTAEKWYMKHQDHGGLMLPGLIERVDDTFTTNYIIESVEINPDLDDSLFAVPAEEVPAEE